MDHFPQLELMGAEDFIPPVLAPFRIEPIDCRVTKTEHTDKVEFAFELRWTAPKGSVGPCTFAEKKIETKSRTSTDRSTSRTESTSASESQDESSRTSQKNRAKKLDSDLTLYPHPSTLRCDGPCGRKLSVRDLLTAGSCLHSLCRNCRELVTKLDGKSGCSAFECTYKHLLGHLDKNAAKKLYDEEISHRLQEKGRMQETLDELKKNYPDEDMSSKASSRKTSTGSSSVTSCTSEPTSIASTTASHVRPDQIGKLFSQLDLVTAGKEDFAGEAEMISVRLLLLLRNKRRDVVLRRDFTEEYPARFRLRDVVEHVAASITNWSDFDHKIKVWVVPPQKGSRMELIPNQRGDVLLHELGVHAGQLRMIIDGANLIKS